MARPTKEKVELINTMPSDPVQRERLRKSVQEAVDILLQMSALKEEFKNIVSIEKEAYHIDPKFFKTTTKIAYTDQFEAKKERIKIEQNAEMLAEVDILMKGSNL
jgi:hypothetical protein